MKEENTVTKNNLWDGIGKFFVGGIATIIALAFSGWAVSLGWAWYISPLFGVRGISIGEAVGLTFFAMFLNGGRVSDDKKSTLEYCTKMGQGMLVTACILGILWILTYVR